MPCKHFFSFPPPSGPTITGVCQLCGATQTVPTMGTQPGDKWHKERAGARSKFRSAAQVHTMVVRTEDDVVRLAQARQQAGITSW